MNDAERNPPGREIFDWLYWLWLLLFALPCGATHDECQWFVLVISLTGCRYGSRSSILALIETNVKHLIY
jgi:hypothetical protein